MSFELAEYLHSTKLLSLLLTADSVLVCAISLQYRRRKVG